VTTENGLGKLQHVRRNIEVLADRLAYLDEWLARHEAATGQPDTGVRACEARAIRWALPVLEAEWDSLARIQRTIVMPAEGRAKQAEQIAQLPERPSAAQVRELCL
jgi:hypothetical protein